MNFEQKLQEEIEEEKANDPIMPLWEAAEEKFKTTNFTRYKTGIDTIDGVSKLREEDKGGFAGGDVIIISAPTGNGKTTLAATLSHSMFKNEGLPSLWFTYEVSIYQLWQNFQAMGADKNDVMVVPFEHTTGKMEWVEKKIKEAKEKYWAKVVVIDHLGFLTPTQKMNSNMSQNYASFLTQIVRELKTIAVREDIIIILPAHMIKAASDDPTLKDIGHSGGIAQEADFVILMAREEAKKSKSAGALMEDYYTPFTKVILAKNRIGGKTPSFWMEKKDGKLIQTFKPYEQTRL